MDENNAAYLLLVREIEQLNHRVALCERVFKKLMEFDMRLDTLEFNSNAPVKPGISEKLATLEYKIETIFETINPKEQVNE